MLNTTGQLSATKYKVCLLPSGQQLEQAPKCVVSCAQLCCARLPRLSCFFCRRLRLPSAGSSFARAAWLAQLNAVRRHPQYCQQGTEAAALEAELAALDASIGAVQADLQLAEANTTKEGYVFSWPDFPPPKRLKAHCGLCLTHIALEMLGLLCYQTRPPMELSGMSMTETACSIHHDALLLDYIHICQKVDCSGKLLLHLTRTWCTFRRLQTAYETEIANLTAEIKARKQQLQDQSTTTQGAACSFDSADGCAQHSCPMVHAVHVLPTPVQQTGKTPVRLMQLRMSLVSDRGHQHALTYGPAALHCTIQQAWAA